MKTESIKSSEIVRNWHLVDAKDKTLGRLASNIAQILRGKNKVNFTPRSEERRVWEECRCRWSPYH